MPDAATTLIEAAGLSKRYGGVEAVRSLDLTVQAGEVFGLLGPNGAGKTTTILMLLGLSEPSAGVVRVCGLDPARDPLAVKRQVGYLPDAVGFYEQLTGRQNLRYTAELNEIAPSEVEERIEWTLEQVGLTADADRPVGEYSRGMRQRLGIADVLIKDPAVVILDEPTSAIDPEGVAAMQRLIVRLAHDEGRAVLLSSHLLHQMQRICDRVAIFVDGRVIAQGSPFELGQALANGRTVHEIMAEAEHHEVMAALTNGFGDRVVDVEQMLPGRWRVSMPADESRRLVRVLVDGNVEVREVRDLGSDLDQVYHRYFEERQGVAV